MARKNLTGTLHRVSRTVNLLFVAVALGSGCAPVVRSDGPREIATHFLFFKKDRGGPAGGLGPIYVEVQPNHGNRAPVRIAETVSGGTGGVWRATVWMALLSAAEILDVDPMAWRVTVEAEGAVDGPSAGALLTAVIVAAVRGRPLRPDAIVTGTINPDHTIGPVGGVVEKVEAALAAGRKRIGVPVGQLSVARFGARQTVDVVALARARGAEVTVVRDARDAYHLLTGDTLPAPRALERSAMRQPEWAREVFARHARAAVARVQRGRAALRELIERLGSEAVRAADASIAAELKRVEVLLERGDAVNALYHAAAVQAGHLALSTRLVSSLGLRLHQWRRVERLVSGLQAATGALLQETIPRWKALMPRRAIDVPFAVDVFEAVIHTLRDVADAHRLVMDRPALKRLMAEGVVDAKPEVLEAIGGSLPQLTQLLIGAQSNLLLGRAYLDAGKAQSERRAGGDPAPLSADAVADVRRQIERVADANLQYVETLVILPEALARKERPEVTRERMMRLDSDYRQAVLNRRVPAALSETLLTTEERSVAELSGAVSSYFASATLISKRYSLGAQMDPAGRGIVRFRNGAALAPMVESAELRARQAAARALDRLGEIPLGTLIEYALAHPQVRPSAGPPPTGAAALRDKVEALSHLWRATTLSRLAVLTQRRIDAARVAPRAAGYLNWSGRLTKFGGWQTFATP